MTARGIVLSVCIPTYNRLNYLKESLGVLLPQAQQQGVQVCVSDNCSEDGTQEYLSELSKEYSCLVYVAQKSNIGIDRNMQFVISMGEGAYAYPLGDDDFIPEGSLGVILKRIHSGADVIVLNGWHTDSNLAPVRLHLTDIGCFDSCALPCDCFGFFWNKMPFGSFLARRDFFGEEYFSRYIGTSHGYTGAIWDALAQKYRATGVCRIDTVAEPTVMLRGAEKTWRNNAALIMLNEIPRWFSLVANNVEYRDCINNIRSCYLLQQTRVFVLFFYRSIGQLEPSMVINLGQECTLWQRLKLRSVSIFPKFAAAALLSVRGFMVRIIKRAVLS